MEINKIKEDVKKAAVIFWFNLCLSALAFVVLIKSIAGNNELKIIAATIGFTMLISLTTLVFIRLLKLQKAAKG